jgi:uncharacterized protein (TIGR02284 family)
MATPAAGDTGDILKILIENCRDGAEGFRAAAAEVSDPTLERLLESYGEQLAGFAAELCQEAIRLGQPVPERARSLDSSPGWGAEENRGDEAKILSTCEHREHLTVRAFREALRTKLPGPIGATVERLFLQVKEAHAHILTLEEHTSRAG